MFGSIQLFSDEILILQLICRHGDLVKPMKLEGFLGLTEVWRYIIFVFMWEMRVQCLKELNSLEFGGKMRWFIDEEEPNQSQRWGADNRQVLSQCFDQLDACGLHFRPPSNKVTRQPAKAWAFLVNYNTSLSWKTWSRTNQSLHLNVLKKKQ